MEKINEYYLRNGGNYLKKNPNWHSEDSPWKASQIIKILAKNNVEPKSVLEIGCGVGEVLNQLSLLIPNCKFNGIDISIDAIDVAKHKMKQNLSYALGNIDEINEFFDLLMLIDVFEHVKDYLGFLEKCKNVSKYKVFHIPLDISVLSILRNGLIKLRNDVGHLHYFTKDTAIASLKDLGFEIIDFSYTTPVFDLPAASFLERVAFLPRWIIYRFSPDLASKLLGGFSLIVLAK